MLTTRVRRAIGGLLPGPVRYGLGKTYGAAKVRSARQAFERCDASPAYLRGEELDRLMREGFRPPDAVRYDPEGLKRRAEEKIQCLAGHDLLTNADIWLELGCWDGMVGALLAQRGKRVWALDLVADGLDRRAIGDGVKFVQGDVHILPVKTNSVDVMFSFAAFEHFASPRNVLTQAWRALRPGGHLFLMFGPVYTSPYGRHAYRQIPVPYCHFLFQEVDLRAYALDRQLPVAWPYVNGVSVSEYRELFREQKNRFETVYYREHSTGGVGAELISRYPACFKGRVPSFDDLIVSSIELCLRKRPAAPAREWQ